MILCLTARTRVACVACAVATVAATNAVQMQGSVEISAPSTMVAGLPMPVRIVVHGAAEVVPAGLFRSSNPIDVVMNGQGVQYTLRRRITQATITAEHVNTELPREEMVPTEQIGDGVTTEWTLDALRVGVERLEGQSAVGVLGDALVPGTYGVSCTSTALAVGSAPASLTIAAPNTSEAALCAAIRPYERAGVARWEAFVLYSDKILEQCGALSLSEPGTKQLQYYVVLARLVREPAPIGQLSITAAEETGLWVGYEVDLLVLKYEMAVAAGQTATANALKDQILSRRPTAGTLLSRIANGDGGPIRQFRDRR
jgi:hypothetical protein